MISESNVGTANITRFGPAVHVSSGRGRSVVRPPSFGQNRRDCRVDIHDLHRMSILGKQWGAEKSDPCGEGRSVPSGDQEPGTDV